MAMVEDFGRRFVGDDMKPIHQKRRDSQND